MLVARGLLVDRPGEEVLAGAGLLQQQHRAVLGRDLDQLLHHRGEVEAGTDDLLVDPAPQLPPQEAVVVRQALLQLDHLAVLHGVGQRDEERPADTVAKLR